MKRSLAIAPLILGIAMLRMSVVAEPSGITAIIRAQPLNAGRIDPMLFGNFIELLDDVVPGMWAEMLNDRSFAGIAKLSDWCYYDGAPDCCDRPWDANDSWAHDA